jgi:hypothetical protein
MKYLEQVWFLLFTPGERDCVMGYSHDIVVPDEEDDEDMGDEDIGDAKGNKDELKDLQDEADIHEQGEVKGKEKEDKGDEEVKGVKQDKEEMEDEEDEEEEEIDEDEDYEPEQRGAAEETALAQQFDVTLEQEVSRGMAVVVKISNKLGGWSASMLEDNLMFAQYAEAVMTLPTSHPAYRTLISNVFSQFR